MKKSSTAGQGWECCSVPPFAPRLGGGPDRLDPRGVWARSSFACLLLLGSTLGLGGLFIVNPNEAKVLQLFGKYVGTARQPGLRWANPFFTRSRSRCARATSRPPSSRSTTRPATRSRSPPWSSGGSSTRPRRCSTSTTTSTSSTSRASRRCATSRPTTPTSPTSRARCRCRATPPRSSERLQDEIQERLAQAGVEVLEARISHLAYCARDRLGDAPAPAGERRGRGARRRSSRAPSAWSSTPCRCSPTEEVVELDDERKAAMVSNLLVVLCGDRPSAAGDQRRQPLPLSRGGLGRTQELPAAARPRALRGLRRWADDELRSVNAQIEFLLARALRQAGRAPRGAKGDRPDDKK